jgi:hypothetical protein
MCLRLVVLLVCLLWVSPRCPEQDADKFVGQPTASIQVPGFLFFYFICAADNLVTLFKIGAEEYFGSSFIILM